MPRSAFLWSNPLATATTAKASALARNVVLTNPIKSGSGSAEMFVQLTGAGYAGPSLDYLVEIDSVALGKEIAQAKYKWSDDDGATFDATAVATHTAFATLNNNIQIRWAQGTGDDVALGDWWRFRALVEYPLANLSDFRRGTIYRSSTNTGWDLQIRLAAGVIPNACALLGHNLAGVTLTLTSYTDTGDTWVTSDQSETFLLAGTRSVKFLSNFTNSRTNFTVNFPLVPGISYHEVAELFLGRYYEFDYEYRDTFTFAEDTLQEREEAISGRVETIVRGARNRYRLPIYARTQAHYDGLVAVYEGVKATNKQPGLLWYDSYQNEVFLVDWISDWQFRRIGDPQGHWVGIADVELEELV